MTRTKIIQGIAASCLIGPLVAGGGSAWALTQRVHHAQHSAEMTGAAPRTWHVIAGFSQLLPGQNDNREAVDQFYPRKLTIFPGDKVTWTINALNDAHTVTFAPDAMLRHLEDPQVQAPQKEVNGKTYLIANPAVFFPSSRGPLVETDSGSAKTLLNCGILGPGSAKEQPQTCTITFPNVGTYAYDCLLHSGIPGNEDMDGVIKVVPRPQPKDNTWMVMAGTGNAIDAQDGYFPEDLTIHVGDHVRWKAGGVHFHTVSFGVDPRKIPLFLPVGKTDQGPVLAWNPQVIDPIIPPDGMYSGGVASSGILGLEGNYMNLPGQKFTKTPFALTFVKPGVYTYYCLIHPRMQGTISVLPAGQ